MGTTTNGLRPNSRTDRDQAELRLVQDLTRAYGRRADELAVELKGVQRVPEPYGLGGHYVTHVFALSNPTTRASVDVHVRHFTTHPEEFSMEYMVTEGRGRKRTERTVGFDEISERLA